MKMCHLNPEEKIVTTYKRKSWVYFVFFFPATDKSLPGLSLEFW